MATVKPLPIRRTAFDALRFIAQHRSPLVGGVFGIVVAAMPFFLPVAWPTGGIPLLVVVLCAYFFAAAIAWQLTATKFHRRAHGAPREPFTIRASPAERALLWTWLRLAGLAVIPAGALALWHYWPDLRTPIPTAVRSPAVDAAGGLTIFWYWPPWLVFGASFGLVLVRCGISLPAAALGKPIRFREAFELTKGHAMRIAAVGAVLLAPAAVILALVAVAVDHYAPALIRLLSPLGVPERRDLLAVVVGVSWVALAVLVSAWLSAVYRRIVLRAGAHLVGRF